MRNGPWIVEIIAGNVGPTPFCSKHRPCRHNRCCKVRCTCISWTNTKAPRKTLMKWHAGNSMSTVLTQLLGYPIGISCVAISGYALYIFLVVQLLRTRLVSLDYLCRHCFHRRNTVARVATTLIDDPMAHDCFTNNVSA